MSAGFRTGLVIFGVFLLAGSGGFFLGRTTTPSSSTEESVDDWLGAPADTESPLKRMKEKNLELLGKIMLLKKMLGEIEGELVLMGPVGERATSRGRLVWDSARMEGFIHAVQLPAGPAVWQVEIFHKNQLLTQCPLPAPDVGGILQAGFRPNKRILEWDRFQLVRQSQGQEMEVVLAGVRP